jgi:hypothetical protein
MLWKLALQGVVVLACDVAGIGVIPVALEMVGVLASIVTIIGADDPRTEIKNVLKDCTIGKIADRIVDAAVGGLG